MTLEEAFHREMLSGDELLRKKFGYNATYFKQLVHQYGGVEAARRLLVSKEAQTGLFKLWELGCLEMSMENLVLQDRYASLFTPEELNMARKRLRDLQFTPVQLPVPTPKRSPRG